MADPRRRGTREGIGQDITVCHGVWRLRRILFVLNLSMIQSDGDCAGGAPSVAQVKE